MNSITYESLIDIECCIHGGICNLFIIHEDLCHSFEFTDSVVVSQVDIEEVRHEAFEYMVNNCN